MNKSYLKVAGILNAFTACLHLIAGQVDLVRPLIASNLALQQKAEWTSVWHMVTVLLFFSGYMILKTAFSSTSTVQILQLRPLGLLYILVGLPFIASSLYFGVFAPQWLLLMPIGVLVLLGIRKASSKQVV